MKLNLIHRSEREDGRVDVYANSLCLCFPCLQNNWLLSILPGGQVKKPWRNPYLGGA